MNKMLRKTNLIRLTRKAKRTAPEMAQKAAKSGN